MRNTRWHLFVNVLVFALIGNIYAEIKVYSDNPTIPVLINRADNMVLRISVEGPGVLNEIVVDTSGTTDLNDIVSSALFYAGAEQPEGVKTAYQQVGSAQKPAAKIIFKEPQELFPGTNYFIISYRLRPDTNLLHVLGAKCVSVDG